MNTTSLTPHLNRLCAAILCLALLPALGHATSFTLAWQDNSTDESGFAIERSPDNITFTPLATTAAGATTYSDAGLPDLTTYYYRVRAYRDEEFSLYSNTAEASTGDTQPPLIQSATAFGTPSRVVIIFDEPLDATTAGNPGNYALSDGFAVDAASAAGDTVTLTVTPAMTAGSYTVTVTGVADLSGNLVAPASAYALTYSTADPTLVCWYPFNILATDESGSGSDGIISGATLTADGKLGQGYLFAAGGDHIQMPLGKMSPAAGTFTAWIKPMAFSAGAHSILGHSSSTTAWNDRLQIYTDDIDGNLDLGMGDNHAVQTGILPLVAQEWVHLALTWDGTVYRLYVNGTEMATGPYSGLTQLGSFADVGNSGMAGARTTNFNGVIDEVRVYTRPLDPAEVAAMSTLPRPKAPTDLRIVE